MSSPTEGRTSDDLVRDHLANERTLLAWQRTALTVMGLGVLVDRISVTAISASPGGPLIGIALIGMGGLVSLIGAYRFLRTGRDIARGRYREALVANLVLTGLILAGGIVLAAFLLAR